MKNIHFVTLPKEQASLFYEICSEFGLYTTIFRETEVMTVCEDKDRDAAWALFVEKMATIFA